MNPTPFITIRRYETTYGPKMVSGYRWECARCGVGGTHRFNRWTDHVRRNNPDPHPWRRCIIAVDAHLRHHHRQPPVVVNVTVHVR